MITPATVRRPTTSSGVKRRYRSGLEEAIAHQIESANLPIYEETTLDYIWPARPSKYTPDFQVGDIHLEVKGLFDVQARHKMLLVKQHTPTSTFASYSATATPNLQGQPDQLRTMVRQARLPVGEPPNTRRMAMHP